jgi:hypothetical protein
MRPPQLIYTHEIPYIPDQPKLFNKWEEAINTTYISIYIFITQLLILNICINLYVYIYQFDKIYKIINIYNFRNITHYGANICTSGKYANSIFDQCIHLANAW